MDYYYQWRHNSTNITGATNQIYDVDPEYVGEQIDCVVTATDGIGIGSIDSPDTNAIVQKSGTLWGWGYNGSGNIADGTTVSKSSPIQIGTGTDWKYISTFHSTLAIKTDGTLWAWGINEYGQSGFGNTLKRSSPVQVGTGNTWKSVITDYHTLALKTDGTLWSWGYNGEGQLGDGTTVDKSSPVQVGSLTDWKKIVCSGTYSIRTSLVLKTDGTLWAWGNNSWGQLGLGDTIHRLSPVQVGTDKWINVHGGISVIGLKTNGTIWTWGTNTQGQLGNNASGNVSRSSPVQLGTLNDWKYVFGGTHMGAIKISDGSLWMWGYNPHGDIGDGSIGDKSSPVQVSTTNTPNSNWKKISFNSNYEYENTIGLKYDGTLWAWGNNELGQSGFNNTTQVQVPVQVGTLNNWADIAAGDGYTMAIKSV